MDGSFRVVAGLADASGVSFQASNYPDMYLRHRDGAVILTTIDGDLDREDATFFRRGGLAGAGKSFESFNYPRRYIRHRDSLFYVEAADTSDLFKQDASFDIVTPLFTP